MKCPNCSNEVPDTANVCGYCGQRLKSAAPPPQPVYAKPTAKKVTAPVAQSGVWWRFGVLLFGAVLMSFSNAVFHPSSFSAEYTYRGIGLILLAFAAVSYWQSRNRGLGCFIGVVGLGLLMTFILIFRGAMDTYYLVVLFQVLFLALWAAVVWALADALRNK